MSTEQDRIERVCEHVGIEAWPRLKLLAEHFATAFKCNVHVYGSVLRTKDWRDVDLMLEFDYDRHSKIGAPGWGREAYAIATSALSMYASQVVGLRCEVHQTSQKMAHTPFLELAKGPL